MLDVAFSLYMQFEMGMIDAKNLNGRAKDMLMTIHAEKNAEQAYLHEQRMKELKHV